MGWIYGAGDALSSISFVCLNAFYVTISIGVFLRIPSLSFWWTKTSQIIHEMHMIAAVTRHFTADKFG
jgi:hypothetical protein